MPQITVDKQRLCVLVNGEPFFPVGTSMATSDQMPVAAAAGFNLMIHWGMPRRLGNSYQEAIAHGEQAGKAWLRQYLDAGQKAGL